MMHRSWTLASFHLFITALTFTHATGSAITTVKDSECDCYLTNGTRPIFYANHKFFDFRNLTRFAGVPAIVPSSISSSSSSTTPSSGYFSSAAWTSTWQIQSWNNSKGGRLKGDATVLRVNSPNNIYIETSDQRRDSTYLTMRTSRLADFQTASEVQSTSSGYRFLSLRMLARTTGADGGVSAVFTYRDAQRLSDIQEADMEIVTRGPRDKVQYTNQPSYSDAETSAGHDQADVAAHATRNATMPFNKQWTSWAVYRLDWTPESSIWYVDGQEVASISFQVPRDPASINFNSWGDGGSWSGNMSIGAQASLQIQWIEIIYNSTAENRATDRRRRRSITTATTTTITATTGTSWLGLLRDRALRRRGAKEGQCRAVCSIDESSETGAAAKLWGDKSSAAAWLVVLPQAWALMSIVGVVSCLL
ncbi:Concanavalin A-like lectin/glucanase [Moelleriella libera RCEF 2490]|uniref:Concanavalin A-like lectin/glucanase n=1 Tax=Moelleriella libera RCEF 2490 TaxID=1081109 RepID=A0A166PCS1_9HYPO|nr:Concanavalin A-like lectin/glucanase [Moelleriella libera RCEF 2490]